MIQNRLSADRKTVRTQEDPYDVTKHNASDDNEEALLLEELADVSDAHDDKLITIEENATADQTDEEIETAYNSRVSAGSQAEAEAGTSTTIRRWSIAIIFAGWLSWVANKTIAALATTNKTLVGAINELKNAIDNLSSSPAVPEDYTTVAALIADQNSQSTDSLYRIYDTSRDFRVQYLGTIVGDHTDYAGWPTYIFAQEGNNETLEFKVPEYNLKPKSVKVLCKNTLTSQLSINPQVGGVNLLNSPIVVPIGGQHGISSDFNLSTIDAWDEISVVIANTNTIVEVVIDCIEISDAISVPIPKLQTPTMGTPTVDSGTSLTFSWNDPNTSPNESGVDFIWDTASDFSVNPTTVSLAADSTSHQLTGLTEGVTIYGKVVAKGDGLNNSDSDESGVVWATPQATSYLINHDFATDGLTGWDKIGTFDANNDFTHQAGVGVRCQCTGNYIKIRPSSPAGGEVLTTGVTYNVRFTVVSIVVGDVGLEKLDNSRYLDYDTVQTYEHQITADKDELAIRRGAGTTDMVFSLIQVWEA